MGPASRGVAILLALGVLSACSRSSPPSPEGAASGRGTFAAARPSSTSAWAPKKPSGKTDPGIHDEWNQPPARPVGLPMRCTQRGCGTHSVTLHGSLSAVDAEAGPHTFTVIAGGRTITCKIDVRSSTQTSDGTCTGEATASVGPKMRVVEAKSEGMVAATEEPIPGELEWRVAITGEPQNVRVIHRSGVRTVLDATARALYRPSWPNGPGCDPPCFRADVEMAPTASPAASMDPRAGKPAPK